MRVSWFPDPGEIQPLVLDLAVPGGTGGQALLLACNTARRRPKGTAGKIFPSIISIIERIRAAARLSAPVEVPLWPQVYNCPGSYQNTIKATPRARVYGQACPLFVPFVERGQLNGRELEAAAENIYPFWPIPRWIP